MGANTPDKILADWKLEKITTEQAVGQRATTIRNGHDDS